MDQTEQESTPDEQSEIEQSEIEQESPDVGAEEETVVLVDGEQEDDEQVPEIAPNWVKAVRQRAKDTAAENRALRSRMQDLENQARRSSLPEALDPGPKPTLAGHDYDEDLYVAAHERWAEQKRLVDERQVQSQLQHQEARNAWGRQLADYGTKKSQLKINGLEEAEAIAQQYLHPVQLGIIVQGAKNSALVVYALGKDPERAKKFASITDPVKFAFAVAELETSLKTETRQKAPPPARIPVGSAPRTGGGEAQLDKLRDEAKRTGDYSKLFAHKAGMKK